MPVIRGEMWIDELDKNKKNLTKKETMEQLRYQTDSWEKPTNHTGIYKVDKWQAEYRGHLDLYLNQGLYPKVTTGLSKPIDNYIQMMKLFNENEIIFSIVKNGPNPANQNGENRPLQVINISKDVQR